MTCFLVVGTVMMQLPIIITHIITNTELKLEEYTSELAKLDCCFHLWEFIFEEQLDMGIYFQRKGPL